MQSWISEEEVTTWLSKYDWDKSGDISFAEFAALVSCTLAAQFAITYKYPYEKPVAGRSPDISITQPRDPDRAVWRTRLIVV